MEFVTTEVNRVFGQEMARLFAAQISEEEMTSKAKEIWADMNYNKYSYGNRQDSQIETFVKGKIKDLLAAKVAEIAESEEFRKNIERRAKEIVSDIVERTQLKVIDEVSSRLAGLSVGGYGCGLKGYIEQTIMEMMH